MNTHKIQPSNARTIQESDLAKIPKPYREVVAMHHVEKRSYTQIAQYYKCPLGTIKSSIHRGMSYLQEPLRETSPER